MKINRVVVERESRRFDSLLTGDVFSFKGAENIILFKMPGGRVVLHSHLEENVGAFVEDLESIYEGNKLIVLYDVELSILGEV